MDEKELNELSITPCGHVFCTECITMDIQIRGKCSICRKPLQVRDLELLALQVQDYK